MIYNIKNLTIRDTIDSDLPTVVADIRQSDVDEIMASHQLKPEEALSLSFKHSNICWTAIYKGTPVAIFGVYVLPDSEGKKASIWLLGTNGLDRIKIILCKEGKKIVTAFLKGYPLLYNFVDVRNKKTIAWLKYLGAKFQEPAPYGKDGLPFIYFSFEKESVQCAPLLQSH